MLRRVVALFVLLSFALVTTAAQAHGGRAITNGSFDGGHVMADSGTNHAACDEKSACGPDHAGLCAAVCASLLGHLPPLEGDALDSFASAAHAPPADMTAPGRSPALSDPPPKTRL